MTQSRATALSGQAACFISEQGLNNLMLAGISTGWLRAWLLAGGAESITLAVSGDDARWPASEAAYQLFIASPEQLQQLALQHGVGDLAALHGTGHDTIELMNPDRHAYAYSLQGCRIVLLPCGDIAYQRQHWLQLLYGTAPRPLYIVAGDDGPVALEPGLSATLALPAAVACLNNAGLLLEEQVMSALMARQLSLRTAESCTAGSIIARLCRMPGASAVVDRAWVTYTNAAKQDEVAVAAELIMQYGAVSQAVVQAMAEGGADAVHICVAVSGIAGPGGATAAKPVGTVWIAVAGAGMATVSRCVQLAGARHEVQSRSVVAALSLLLEQLSNIPERV